MTKSEDAIQKAKDRKSLLFTFDSVTNVAFYVGPRPKLPAAFSESWTMLSLLYPLDYLKTDRSKWIPSDAQQQSNSITVKDLERVLQKYEKRSVPDKIVVDNNSSSSNDNSLNAAILIPDAVLPGPGTITMCHTLTDDGYGLSFIV